MVPLLLSGDIEITLGPPRESKIPSPYPGQFMNSLNSPLPGKAHIHKFQELGHRHIRRPLFYLPQLGEKKRFWNLSKFWGYFLQFPKKSNLILCILFNSQPTLPLWWFARWKGFVSSLTVCWILESKNKKIKTKSTLFFWKWITVCFACKSKLSAQTAPLPWVLQGGVKLWGGWKTVDFHFTQHD